MSSLAEKLSEYQWRLVRNNFGLIEKAVGVYLRKHGLVPNLNAEDMNSASAQGLIKAAMSYCPRRGRFEPYAIRCMFSKMTDEVRRLHRKKWVRLPTIAMENDGEEITADDFVEHRVPSPPDQAEQIELLQMVVSRMSPEEKLFVFLHYVIGLRNEEAGKLAFGVRRTVTWQKWKEVRERLCAEVQV